VTKPQTLAYAQQDSPVGLLAWMLEKFWAWTDHGEDLWEAIDQEKVLTTATLYWLTGRVLSSARIYYEFRTREDDIPSSVTVPVWFAPYPKDPWSPPRSLFAAGEFVNVAGYSEPPAGGHFPAMEVPDFWARDVAAFFAKL
jgi:epoxide hydrolase